MSDISELREKLQQALKEQEAALAMHETLEQRRATYAETLESLEIELADAITVKNQAIAHLARGDGSEQAVDKARKLVTGVQKNVDDAAEIVAAIDRELAALPKLNNTEDPLYQLFQKLKRELWREACDLEFIKARETIVPALERLYLLVNRSRGYTQNWAVEHLLISLLAPGNNYTFSLDLLDSGAKRHEEELLCEYFEWDGGGVRPWALPHETPAMADVPPEEREEQQ